MGVVRRGLVIFILGAAALTFALPTAAACYSTDPILNYVVCDQEKFEHIDALLQLVTDTANLVTGTAQAKLELVTDVVAEWTESLGYALDEALYEFDQAIDEALDAMDEAIDDAVHGAQALAANAGQSVQDGIADATRAAADLGARISDTVRSVTATGESASDALTNEAQGRLEEAKAVLSDPPAVPVPEAPSAPALPALPQVPQVSVPSLPSVSLPEAPDIPRPTAPQVPAEAPSAPQTPQAPSVPPAPPPVVPQGPVLPSSPPSLPNAPAVPAVEAPAFPDAPEPSSPPPSPAVPTLPGLGLPSAEAPAPPSVPAPPQPPAPEPDEPPEDVPSPPSEASPTPEAPQPEEPTQVASDNSTFGTIDDVRSLPQFQLDDEDTGEDPAKRVAESRTDQHPLVRSTQTVTRPVRPAVSIEVVTIVVVSGAGLLWIGLPFLYNRLTGKRVEGNALRQRLLEVIRLRPASTVPELARALGVHATTVSYHLRVLRRYGHIVLHAEPSNQWYFENHGRYAPEARRAMAALQRPGNREFLLAVQATSGRRLADIAAHLRVPVSTAGYRASVLVKANLLQREGKTWRPTPVALALLHPSAAVRPIPPALPTIPAHGKATPGVPA